MRRREACTFTHAHRCVEFTFKETLTLLKHPRSIGVYSPLSLFTLALSRIPRLRWNVQQSMRALPVLSEEHAQAIRRRFSELRQSSVGITQRSVVKICMRLELSEAECANVSDR